VGRTEMCAAWSKRSEEGRDYPSLKRDDRSMRRSKRPCSTKKATMDQPSREAVVRTDRGILSAAKPAT
jgi:uncharacterized protein (DUF736 family)